MTPLAKHLEQKLERLEELEETLKQAKKLLYRSAEILTFVEHLSNENREHAERIEKALRE